MFRHVGKAPLTMLVGEGGTGLSTVIEEFLRLHDRTDTLLGSPLLTIHANQMLFDQDGKLTGFGPQMITTRNKRDVLHATDIQAQAQKLLLERPNVLLLGDNLNDADVVAGLPASISCIKVGFANRPDASVSDYLARFDAVVTGDGPMDFVHRLVQLAVTREHDT